MPGRPGRPRKKAPADDQIPAGMVDVDDIEDGQDQDQDQLQDQAAPKKRGRKPGPRKVLDHTSKTISDTGADALVFLSSSGGGKGLTRDEAQSLSAPITRIIGRRAPAWLKKFAPRTKLSPEDAADIQEIVLTLGKYALRLLMLAMQESISKKEDQLATRQQAQVTRNVPAWPGAAAAPGPAIHMPPAAPAPGPAAPGGQDQRGVLSSAMHNTSFDVLGMDYGQGDVA